MQFEIARCQVVKEQRFPAPQCPRIADLLVGSGNKKLRMAAPIGISFLEGA